MASVFGVVVTRRRAMNSDSEFFFFCTSRRLISSAKISSYGSYFTSCCEGEQIAVLQS